MRKLHDRECPHNIYIQNYTSAASSCIALRKWCFDVEKEAQLCEEDEQFRNICKAQKSVDLIILTDTNILQVFTKPLRT